MNVIPIYKGTIFTTLLNGEDNWNYSVAVNTNTVKKNQMKTQDQSVRSVFVNLNSTWNVSVVILSRYVLGEQVTRRLKGHFSKKPESVIQANAHIHDYRFLKWKPKNTKASIRRSNVTQNTEKNKTGSPLDKKGNETTEQCDWFWLTRVVEAVCLS